MLNIFILSCSSDSKNAQTTGLTLSGTITVKSQTTLDADVGERFSTFVDSNNTIADAQIITNPITVGGYISGIARSYPSDSVEFAQDETDFFKVSLLEGQTLSLSIYFADDSQSAVNQADIALQLLDASTTSEVASTTIETVGAKSVQVTQTGDYYIRLQAGVSSSPMLYVLSLSDNLSLEDAALLKRAIEEDFVPFQVLIGQGKSKRTQDEMSLPATLSLKRRIGNGSSLYTITENTSLRKATINGDVTGQSSAKEIESKWETLKEIHRLEQTLNADYVEPNYIRKAVFTPNDARFSDQWNLATISAPDAWDVTTGSSSVVVAVIDSGIDLQHDDLRDNTLSNGYDFVSDTTISGDADGIDSNPQDLSSSKHGSHVAGIIGAVTNNGIGVASVGFNTSIMPLRVLGVENSDGESTGNDADIAEAIHYAAGLQNASGQLISAPVDVINLSLGSAAESFTLKSAVSSAIQQGVIVVAAAGNGGLNQNFYPAAYEGVIAVSSVTSQGELSSFSNYGAFIDVSAPGGAASDQSFNVGEQGILSTVEASNYSEYVGTSMAAPHVSATVALMRSLNSSLDSSAILSAMHSGTITDQVGSSEMFGGGLINAHKAVLWADDPSLIPDELSYFPKQFSFLNENTNADLFLSNSGGGTVQINRVTVSDDWIEVNEVDVDSNTGLGVREIRVSNNQVLDSGLISIFYQINGASEQVAEIPVIASKTVNSSQTVGNLFVSMYSETALQNAIINGILTSDYFVSAQLSNGQYSFTFNDVRADEYYIRASSNNDGDGYTFDKGEAVGGYPSLSNFEKVQANSSLSDINFEVQFLEQNITSQGISSLERIH